MLMRIHPWMKNVRTRVVPQDHAGTKVDEYTEVLYTKVC